MNAGLVVIGSGPAGVSAARAYLDAGGPGGVVVLTADVDAPYERPPLSKAVLAGDAPVAPTPIDLDLDGIDLRLGTRVVGLDLGRRVVRTTSGEVPWAQLVIASGVRPVPLDVADPDADVHLLRSLDDARRLTEAAGHARSAVVVGSGFIGCEAAASLARRGVAVTLVTNEPAPQANRLGDHAAAAIRQWLEADGVEVVTGVEVAAVHAPREVHLGNGTTLAPDLVLVALGVAPSTDYLDAAPEILRHEGRVVADERLSAGVDGVWVAGDVARAHHAVAGRPIEVEHWGDALAMGELAGKNAARAADAATAHLPGDVWEDVPGFWSQIGDRQLKYVAWGDGFDTARVDERPGGFTVWYGQGGAVVGALTFEADDDYERAEALVRDGAPLP